MLYKLVVIFFAAAHGLPGAYKKRAKSAERLHALERTTGPKCCECKMSWRFKDILEWKVLSKREKENIRRITRVNFGQLDQYTHCFEPAESISDDGKKESCDATCKPYGTYTSGEKGHFDCTAYPFNRRRGTIPSYPASSHIIPRLSCYRLNHI